MGSQKKNKRKKLLIVSIKQLTVRNSDHAFYNTILIKLILVVTKTPLNISVSMGALFVRKDQHKEIMKRSKLCNIFLKDKTETNWANYEAQELLRKTSQNH